MHNAQNRYGFKFLTTVVFWSLILAAPVVSRATTVYSNFGASFAYDTGEGNLVGNDDAGDNLAEADTFTPGFTSTLQTIEIALSCEFVSDCPDATTVAIETDSGSDSPSGVVLESFTIAGNTLPTFGVSTHLTLTSVLNPTLTSGVQYWIAVESDTNNRVEWNLNSTGDTSDQDVSGDGGTTWFSASGQTPSAYEVDGIASSVPEPGTLGMLLGGGLLLGLLRKIRG